MPDPALQIDPAALRALIDWCVERAERRTDPPAEVQDIPIL
jgi:hypothetical protein